MSTASSSESLAGRRCVYYVEPGHAVQQSLLEHSRRKLLYNELAPVFAQSMTRQAAAESDFLAAVCRQNGVESGARILDVACGIGRHAIELSQRGYKVVGIDGSKELLKIAHASGSAAEFQEGDLCEFSVSEPVDCL